MQPSEIAIWAVAVSIFAHAVAFFFKTPKEAASEQEQDIRDLAQKHKELANEHQRLEIRVEGIYSGHDQILKNLTSAVEKLTTKLERFAELINGRHS